jgi:hypothetical protein
MQPHERYYWATATPDSQNPLCGGNILLLCTLGDQVRILPLLSTTLSRRNLPEIGVHWHGHERRYLHN